MRPIIGITTYVEPELYGASPEPLTVARPERDAAEMLLARAALEADLPILGVCRGLQVLTVAAGGSLHQHLPDVLGHNRHRPEPAVYGAHQARFADGSRLGRRRAARGGRGPGPPVRPRRPVAPRGDPRQTPVRRARRRRGLSAGGGPPTGQAEE